MGRPRKPDVLKRIDGGSSRAARELGNVAGIGTAFVAGHIADDAKACVEIIKRSMPPILYGRIDSFALAAFGMAWAIHKRCCEEINKADFAYVEQRQNGTAYTSPWLKILNEQAHAMASLGGHLGLDPRSRQGLQLPEQPSPESKFSGLIGAVQGEPNGSFSSLKS